ncbi:hypothetical protein ABK040_014817 [Willaertia magna]
MVNRIKLYRAFIPTFLLSELEDNIKNDKQFDEKKLSNDDNKKKNNIVVPFNSSIMQKFELGVERKDVTVLGIKISKFDTLLHELVLSNLFNFISDIFQVVQKLEKTSKGQIGNLNNGILPLIFNGSITLQDHVLKAAKSAELLKKKLEEITKKWKKDLFDNNYEFSLTIITESVVCGNLGTEESKSFTVLGSVYKNLNKILKVNEKYNIPLTLNERASNCCTDKFYIRPLTELKLKNDLNIFETTTIYELGDSNEIVMDEWMYELQQQESKGKWNNYNEGYKLFKEKNYTEALEKFKLFEEKNAEDLVVNDLITICNHEIK